MVQKADIEKAFRLQRSRRKAKSIPRLHTNIKKDSTSHIEVITGVRRCGKSTLLLQQIDEYSAKTAYFNFEDPRVFNFEVGDFQKLDEVVGDDVNYYFFDEIQNVVSWEIFVRHLHDRGKKVFVTGSNASMLSKELGTRLTGRYLAHELFPFSYQEFLVFKSFTSDSTKCEEYLKKGGFPEFLKSENPEILQLLLKDIVYRDIAIRYGIRNSKTLMDITLFLISNIGKEHSFQRLRNQFLIGSANTVSDYASWLEDTYLLFFLPRFSWSARSIAINPRKVYAIDNGLINANTLSFTEDRGRLLENSVYLHFRRQKQYNLFYFREKSECDFLIFENRKCKYVMQVCEQIDGDNQARELRGLLEAIAFFKMNEGYIITLNQNDKLMIEGKTIFLKPAHEFFIEF